LEVRERHIDPASGLRTDHHAWIERYCILMASVALHVAAKHRQALAVIERGRLR
jgi:hypothetical protein